ncbi:MAG: Fe-S cluster assembly protein SufD [Mariprofundaceae bacterium]
MSRWREARAAAWRRFEAEGLPGPKDEHWRLSRLDPMIGTLGERWWAPAAEVQADASVVRALLDAASIEGLDEWRAVFVAGRFAPALSSLPEALDLRTLRELEAADEEAAVLVDTPDAPMPAALWSVNAACALDGLRLRVPDGVRLEKPLRLLHLAIGPGAAHVRHAIEIGRGAQAHVIEHFLSDDATGLTHVVSRMALGEGAVLRHDRLQEEHAASRFHLGRIEAAAARDARLVSHVATLGGRFSRLDWLASLDGEGSECTMQGLYLLGGRQHADHHTRIDHHAPRGLSREHYRGVLDGRARGVFNGCVAVHPGASGTDSAQKNANLLLSPKAEVDAKPELLIGHDDVKAAHGCTVGQLDPGQLFYLESRGVGGEEARRMLIRAFADEVLTGIVPQALRCHIERKAFARLGDGS